MLADLDIVIVPDSALARVDHRAGPRHRVAATVQSLEPRLPLGCPVGAPPRFKVRSRTAVRAPAVQGRHHPGLLRRHQKKSETTFGNVKADVLIDNDPHFVRINFCSIIRGSAWPA
jgi:hypothetical protein